MNDLIYMSYSRKNEDEHVAQTIHNALQKAGFRVWSEENIPLGAPWTRELEQAMRNASKVIVLISPNAKQSDWVQTELPVFLERAHKEGLPVFPVQIAGDHTTIAAINPQLVNYATVDARDNLQTAVEQLIAKLKQLQPTP